MTHSWPCNNNSSYSIVRDSFSTTFVDITHTKICYLISFSINMGSPDNLLGYIMGWIILTSAKTLLSTSHHSVCGHYNSRQKFFEPTPTGPIQDLQIITTCYKVFALRGEYSIFITTGYKVFAFRGEYSIFGSVF